MEKSNRSGSRWVMRPAADGAMRELCRRQRPAGPPAGRAAPTRALDLTERETVLACLHDAALFLPAREPPSGGDGGLKRPGEATPTADGD